MGFGFPNFSFNFVDVRDVAKGIYASYHKGMSGNRYILANSTYSSLSEIFDVAKKKGSNFTPPPGFTKAVKVPPCITTDC